MKNKEEFTILDDIKIVYEKSKDSQFKSGVFQDVPELLKLCHFFSLNEVQTVLYCIIFVNHYDDERNEKSLWRYLNLTSLDSLKYEKDLQILVKKKLIKAEEHRYRNLKYQINELYISDILSNTKFTTENLVEPTLLDAIELFENIKEQFQNTKNPRNLQQDLKDLFMENNFQTFKIIKNLKLEVYQQYFILTSILDALDYGDNNYNTNILSTLQEFFDMKSKSFMIYRKLIKNEDKLTSKNLITVGEGNFRGYCSSKLSNEMINVLKIDGLELDHITQKGKADDRLLYHDKIPFKKLFCNPAELAETEILGKAIDIEGFETLQKRLSEKAMPIGITALLYGASGTGKTESVYQLAKKTGRNIYKVDISRIQSKWFGESQKLVKNIFTTYTQLQEKQEHCPILLFNEADGIIGKRKAAGSSAVADTENAMQNLFLEELENFSGILMATTNLVDNLDSAFERRFLYKIRFENPDFENAVKIWRHRFSFLKEEEGEYLAKSVNFSGGEMENIARKIMMNEILNNIEPSFENILQLCGKERWNEGKKMGF